MALRSGGGLPGRARVRKVLTATSFPEPSAALPGLPTCLARTIVEKAPAAIGPFVAYP